MSSKKNLQKMLKMLQQGKKKKKRTPAQLKASRDESYGKFGSKMKKKGKINR
jgi:hypothetical protein